MRKDRPQTRLRIARTLASWPRVRVDHTLIFGAILSCAAILGAPKGNAIGPARQAAPSDFAGADACASCHEAESRDFVSNPHSKTETRGNGTVTCESCHGPGKAHVESGGDPTKIFDPAKASPKDLDAVCLKCHANQSGPFVYEHAAMKTEGCMACHSIHGAQNARLLKMADVQLLCGQCHSAVSAAGIHEAKAPSSQPGPCTDCHTNIHGSNLSATFLR